MASKKKVVKKAAAKKSASAKKSAGKRPARKAASKPAARAAKKKIAAKAKPKKKTVAKKSTKSKAARPKQGAKKAAVRKSAVKSKSKAKKSAPAKKSGTKKKVVKKATKKAVKKIVKKAVKKSAKKRASAPKKAAAKAATGKKSARKSPIDRKKAAHKLIPQIERATGMYSGVLLCEPQDIKPFPSKTPYSSKELAELRKTLMEERARLIDELDSIHRHSMEALDLAKEHPGYSMHMAEHATDLQTAEANLGVRTIEEERLMAVEAALERIDNNVNHYGLCVACGNKIGIQRLKARPHAHLCMDCRQRYERIRSRRPF